MGTRMICASVEVMLCGCVGWVPVVCFMMVSLVLYFGGFWCMLRLILVLTLRIQARNLLELGSKEAAPAACPRGALSISIRTMHAADQRTGQDSPRLSVSRTKPHSLMKTDIVLTCLSGLEIDNQSCRSPACFVLFG